MGLGTVERAGARATVYYCVDDYAANPGVDADTVRALEAALARWADLTVTTGEPLAQRLRAQAKQVEVLPNVADTELFARESSTDRHPVLEALDALPRPRLGYLGNLAAYKIDLGLVAELARLRPDWTIALVGPCNLGDVRQDIDAQGLPPNVHLVGAVPHDLAPAAIDRFDVALLPSARHDVMQASFPLKFFEYLLRGKPVVARPLPMLEPYRKWFEPASNAEAFVAACARRLAYDPDAELRRRFAEAFGWRERMVRIERLRAVLLGTTQDV